MFDFSVRDVQAQTAAFSQKRAWSGEVKGVRQDGSSYPTALTIVPMWGGDGRITGYVTSHQDISQVKALDKAQYSFITNVSHQLRTPLTNIKLYTQLLEGNLHNQKADHYLHVLNSQAERLEHLVQDILELVSLDSNQSVLDWRSIDFTEMLQQIIEGHQIRVKAQQLTLCTTIQEDIPRFIGDPVRLRQAVNELLDNAFAYTPEGGTIAVTMTLVVSDRREWIAVSVQDNGPGIPEEEQGQIFERFFRGHLAEQGNIIGTGLGLCIAQQIAQAHHGQITLKTALGHGSTFTLWLPIDANLSVPAAGTR
jgi:signal transduction histidine kinase